MIRREADGLTPEGVSHSPDILKRVFLRRNEVPGVLQYAYTTFGPGDVAGAHAHADMVEIFFCHRGRGTLTLDGHDYEISPGCFFVCEPGEVHAIASTQDTGLEFTVVALQA